MHFRNSQKGYALLLMLTGISAATFGVAVLSSLTLEGQWYSLTQDAFQLNNERSRLIYYSVDYARLYGSGGAGPGHLPCPDTDVGTQRPGPNPPCGGALLANGKLPDGVTRTAGRIALTDFLLNRSTYTLSGALVNNPSLPINPMLWPDEIPFESSIDGYVTLSRPSGQTRTLTKKHLEKPTLQWVRAWLSWQLLETTLKYCDKGDALVDNDIGSRAIGSCSRILNNDESAASSVISSVINSCAQENTSCRFSEYEAISWLTDIELEQWQNTRISNHWFVKNRWVELFEIQAQRSCLNRTVDCVLFLDEVEQTLRFRLLPGVRDDEDV